VQDLHSAQFPKAAPTPQQAPRRPHPVSRILTWPFRWFWRVKYGLAFLLILAGSILMIPSESARQSTQDFRYDANSSMLAGIPKRDAALVLGAGVLPDHTPTEYLKHRIETAVGLYKAGRVGALIMSGDNSSGHYDEPTSMKAYAVKLGVPADDIVLDYAGYNTYDSCYRAKSVFQQSSLTVVTQGYHLPRAVLTCRKQGIDAIGVAAVRTGRDYTASYIVREHIATAKAYAQFILKPQPTVAGPPEHL
jgi:vancomycin permeability regulator SanA